MSYGSNIMDGFHQVGLYTGLFFKGAKPADLPVVQSNKFDLVRTQTARTLGLSVPDKLLAVVDAMID
jgi:putative tryptophan/tyrosine transport system substrate-binding protein